MANPEHLEILQKGINFWNKWREKNWHIKIDFSGVDLKGADLSGGEFSGANFSDADLSGADVSNAWLQSTNFFGANLEGADLSDTNLTEAILTGARLDGAKVRGAILIRAQLVGVNFAGADFTWIQLMGTNFSEAKLEGTNFKRASLHGVDLSNADLRGADLSEAILVNADLSYADLRGVDLRNSNLRFATLVETNLEGADLTNCQIYGAAAWNLNLKQTKQSNLIITPPFEPVITVDNLEVAQFVYTLLNNQKIRSVIDTIGEKGVLILGRFTEERKAVLDAIRNKLRELDFLPMMFDFEKPTQRDFTETIKTLAGLSRFIIADITNPKSSPLELQATMPDYMIPFVPIIHEDEQPFAMFRDLKQKYGDWVLDVLEYDSWESLVKVLEKAVVRPALKMSDALLLKKAELIRTRHVKDYEGD